MAAMTEKTKAQPVECGKWEHYAKGHYRPKRVNSGAEILVFEACPVAQEGNACSVCGGSGWIYEQKTMPDGTPYQEARQCTSCSGGVNQASAGDDDDPDWNTITG